jgi:hypothetical protein
MHYASEHLLSAENCQGHPSFNNSLSSRKPSLHLPGQHMLTPEEMPRYGRLSPTTPINKTLYVRKCRVSIQGWFKNAGLSEMAFEDSI